MKNPRNKIIIFVLVVTFIFLCFTTVAFSHSEKPSLSAKAAFLYEPETKTELFSKNPDVKLPMASTTKIMTALIALETLEPSKPVSIDSRAIGIEGSSLYLKAGERLTARDLIIGLMLRSANDAAAALAYEISGEIDTFADLMNERAESLGLENTHFTNPHGLDNDRHYTTARELALITAEALNNPEFKSIVSLKKHIIKNSDGEARLVVNHNKLLTLYDGAIGVKTGFTKKSGRCLVGAAEKNGLTMISVTINAPNDWNDHSMLFEYGFSKLEKRNAVVAGAYKYEIPLLGAESTVTVTNTESFSFITETNSQSVDITVELPKYVISPVSNGDTVGRIIVALNEKEIGSVPLVCVNQS